MATAVDAPIKRSHPLRNFLLKFGLATSVFYTGGTALSLYNDQFSELFIDNVPLAEELVELCESYRDGAFDAPSLSLDEIREKFGEFTRRIVEVPNKGASPANASTVASVEAAAPVAPVKPAGPMIKLVLQQVSLDNTTSESIRELVDSLNATIESINSQSLLLPEEIINSITTTYNRLYSTVAQLNESLNDILSAEINRKASEQSARLEEKYGQLAKSKELELTEKFLNEFNGFKAQLEQQSSQELANALKTNEQALLAKHSNEVALLSIKQVEEFNKILGEKLDKERQGRLSKLTELNDSVGELVAAVDKLDSVVVKNEATTQLTLLVSKLRNKLESGEQSSIHLEKELTRLKTLADILPGKPKKCCSKNPQLLDLAITELDQLTKTEILSDEQLYNRWVLLQKDLKTASLLPPNAGILGHLSAKFFSLFLFNKSGVSTENDMDSVIARVGENLRLSKLDQAVEEAVGLKGWPRVLCDDWVREARRKLEVETLVDVLDCEVRSL